MDILLWLVLCSTKHIKISYELLLTKIPINPLTRFNKIIISLSNYLKTQQQISKERCFGK